VKLAVILQMILEGPKQTSKATEKGKKAVTHTNNNNNKKQQQQQSLT